MTKRRIVFVGNCQVAAVAIAYQRLVSTKTDDEASYIPSYESATDEQFKSISEAHILVQQVLDFAPKIGDLPTNAAVHFVPMLTARFMWPCSGQSHPRNEAHPLGDPSGPYNAELGSSFLNRMITAKVSPKEAVERYLNTDIARVRNVGRMMEILLDKQRARDLACEYQFADFINARFRTERLFRSPNHLEVTLTNRLVIEIFKRLDVDALIVEDIEAGSHDQLFPPTETPIHPSVAAYFGLTHAGPQQTYRYFDEGHFTFEEYAERYMRYEWNPLLVESFALIRTGQNDAAIELLPRALERSHRSAIGWFLFGNLLVERGQFAEALFPAQRALELEPSNARFHDFLATIDAKCRG